jgi:hypothetical protein
MLALALGFSVYSLGPSLYWHFVGEEGALVGWSGACQPCFCDCTHSSDLLTTMPISDGVLNISISSTCLLNPHYHVSTTFRTLSKVS